MKIQHFIGHLFVDHIPFDPRIKFIRADSDATSVQIPITEEKIRLGLINHVLIFDGGVDKIKNRIGINLLLFE